MSVIKSQHIFLPKKQLDLSKWSVIACDQFTSNKEYWDTVKNYVSGSPSTYDLIFPEIMLKTVDRQEYIKQVNKNMQSFYQAGFFEDVGPCMILVNRKTKQHEKRLGIMLNIDLENYSFRVENKALIKATEGTIVDRIPTRVEMRKDAIFELTHVILLYDDRKLKIAEKLYEKKDELEKLYDFNLNLDGGHITGYKIKNVDEVINKFNALLTPEYLKETFNSDCPLLFAVGDGNHSLATAKEHWNNIKPTLPHEIIDTHPARYALVEAINIHDSGIEFSPIHRIITGVKKLKNFVKGLKKLYKVNLKKDDPNSYTTFTMLVDNEKETFYVPKNTPKAIKLVQDYIDNSTSKNFEMSVDYIHGEEELKNLCASKKNSVGIFFPTIEKNELFEFIIKSGMLPRKSFSIGEAKEKRYYLEAHKIKLI